MVRFIFRVLSLFALVLAVITATMDSIQSVSSSEVVLTPFGLAWEELHPASLDTARAVIDRYMDQQYVLEAVDWILQQPTFAVFLALSLLLWMIGYRKPQRYGRFTA